MKLNLRRFTSLASMLVLLLSTLLIMSACGSDSSNGSDDPNNNLNSGIPEVTVTYEGKTITANLDSFGTGVATHQVLTTSTNVYMNDENGKRLMINANAGIDLVTPGKFKTGEYSLFASRDDPNNGKPFASLVLIGATAVGLPHNLEAVSGKLYLDALTHNGIMLSAATFRFDATFNNHEVIDGPTYNASGTINFVFKEPASE